MLKGRKIVVVMPAYNAARTLRQTYSELPFDVVDDVLLVDDASSDETVELAQELGLTTFRHERNLGYGKNQKTCYREALKRNADIVIMLGASDPSEIVFTSCGYESDTWAIRGVLEANPIKT